MSLPRTTLMVEFNYVKQSIIIIIIITITTVILQIQGAFYSL